MEQASKAYRGALRYRTREADPSRWVRTMSNFSVAWRCAPLRQRRHVPGRTLPRGPRGPGHRHEPARYGSSSTYIHSLRTEAKDAHRAHLAGLIERFTRATGSLWGRYLLDEWHDLLGKLWLVKPKAAEMSGLLETLVHRNE